MQKVIVICGPTASGKTALSIELAKKINTYETSILPFEDCCTIFVPKHPVINPSLEKCELEESKFDYETLVNECYHNIFKVELTEKFNEYL